MPFLTPSALRRLVLAGAVAAGLLAAMALPATMVAAQAPTAAPASAAPPSAAPPTASPDAASAAANADAAPASPASKSGKGMRIGISVDTDDADADTAKATGKDAQRGDIVIEKKNKRIHVRGAGKKSDFDSFDELMTDEPTAAMVVSIVAIIFLSPALIVGMVIWYRMRKARMLNETVLKLAERGALPPGEAVQALTMGQLPPGSAFTGPGAAAASGAAALAPMTEVRRAAIRSDLRKAIILAALGVAFTMHSTYDGGSPNVVGLILLFLGIGYGVLWWFESRQIDAAAQAMSPSTPGAGPSTPPPAAP